MFKVVTKLHQRMPYYLKMVGLKEVKVLGIVLAGHFLLTNKITNHMYKKILVEMKMSSKKCKFDANSIFWKRENFGFATFLHSEFSPDISFSNFLENEMSMENSGCKKVAKKKISRFQKIEFASNLHFFDEVVICNSSFIFCFVKFVCQWEAE